MKLGCAAIAVLISVGLIGPAQAADYDVFQLLDERVDNEVRVAELTKLREAAERGDAEAVCLQGRLAMRRTEVEDLGLMHSQRLAVGDGKQFSVSGRFSYKLPSVDFGSASSLLEQCGRAGDIDAFLLLSALEQRVGKSREALIWVGVYAKLASHFCPATFERKQLLVTEAVEDARKKLSESAVSDAEIFQDVDDYLNRNGEAIISGFQRNGSFALNSGVDEELNDGLVRRLNKLARRGLGDLAARGYTASFLLSVSPTGKVDQVYLVEAAPSTHRISGLHILFNVSTSKVEPSTAPRRLIWLTVNPNERRAPAFGSGGCSAAVSGIRK